MAISLRNNYTQAQFERIPTDFRYKGATLGIDAEYLSNSEAAVRLPVKEKDEDGSFKGGSSEIAKKVKVGRVAVYRTTDDGQSKVTWFRYNQDTGAVGRAIINAIVNAGEQSPLSIVALVSAKNLAQTAIRAGFTPISD